MSEFQEIVNALPYEKPFLFVDEIVHLDENGIEGNYRFKEDEYFYQGHFKNYPVTPGVILTECMAQIGLVCLGVYLVKGLRQAQPDRQHNPNASHPEPVEGHPAASDLGREPVEGLSIALTESHVNFLKPVFPGEQVRVVSKKKYFRLGKLKCAVEMFNEKGEKVSYGELSGIVDSAYL